MVKNNTKNVKIVSWEVFGLSFWIFTLFSAKKFADTKKVEKSWAIHYNL